MAEAIVDGAQERKIALVKPDDFESMTGRGVAGRVEGRRVALGNRKLFDELEIDAGPLHERADTLRAEGQTVMYLN